MKDIRHPAVEHPVRLRIRRHRDQMGRVGKVNDYLATHLAVLFGLAGTIWLFLTVPLLVLLAPAGVKAVVFYLASGWIQLFALPLMVYVGNKLQRSSDAQSEVMHQALTHIATVADDCQRLLDLAQSGGLTEVLKAVRSVRGDVADFAEALRPAGGGRGDSH